MTMFVPQLANSELRLFPMNAPTNGWHVDSGNPLALRLLPHNFDNASSLPVGWEPTPYSVVVGRGKARTTATGNKRLQVICKTFLGKYSSASSKIEKTTLVSRIVETVQEACPRGAFVRFVNGRWVETDDHAAREKVGYVMRDLLHDKYKSSSKSKVEKRRSQKSQKKQTKPRRSSTSSDASSSSSSSDASTCFDDDYSSPPSSPVPCLSGFGNSTWATSNFDEQQSFHEDAFPPPACLERVTSNQDAFPTIALGRQHSLYSPFDNDHLDPSEDFSAIFDC